MEHILTSIQKIYFKLKKSITAAKDEDPTMCCEMSSKLTITTPEWCQLCGSGVFIVNCIFHNFSTCFYP